MWLLTGSPSCCLARHGVLVHLDHGDRVGTRHAYALGVHPAWNLPNLVCSSSVDRWTFDLVDLERHRRWPAGTTCVCDSHGQPVWTLDLGPLVWTLDLGPLGHHHRLPGPRCAFLRSLGHHHHHRGPRSAMSWCGVVEKSEPPPAEVPSRHHPLKATSAMT